MYSSTLALDRSATGIGTCLYIRYTIEVKLEARILHSTDLTSASQKPHKSRTYRAVQKVFKNTVKFYYNIYLCKSPNHGGREKHIAQKIN
jgi:hypothetical protein